MLKHVQKMWHRYARVTRLKGVGLFSSMLALAVLSLIVLLIAEQVSEYDFRQRQKTVALDLARLTDATIDLVTQDFKSFEGAIMDEGRIKTLMLKKLFEGNTLPKSFPKGNDQLEQSYGMYIRRVKKGELDILVTTITPGNTPIYNFAAMNNYKGHGHIGIIRSKNRTLRLLGPGLDADIMVYGSVAPKLGETAVITHLTVREVLGDFLYRKPQVGYPDATKMKADLDLGQHDLIGAKNIAATTLTIEQQLTVLGGVTVMEELMVGSQASKGTLTVTGATTVKKLEANKAIFSSAHIKKTLTNDGSTQITGDITVNRGTLTANNANFRAVTARTLTADTLNTGTLNSLHIKVEETATIKDLVANRLIIQNPIETDPPANPVGE